jgi:hypothetical protein
MNCLPEVLINLNLVLLLASPLSNVWATDNINRCIEFYSPPSKIEISAYVAITMWHADIETGDTAYPIRTARLSDVFGGFLPRPSDFELFEHRFINSKRGQSATHQAYGQGADSHELALTKNLDDRWFKEYSDSGRMGYALLDIHTPAGIRQAHLRVIDGTGSGLKPTDEPIPPGYFVPAEHLLAEKGIRTKVLDEYRRNGYRVFELGKYFIDSDLNSRDYRAARVELWKWFYRHYLVEGKLKSSKVIFVFDVFNEERRDSTIKNFGARLLSPDQFEPPLNAPNFILVSDLPTMREHVSRIIEKRKN